MRAQMFGMALRGGRGSVVPSISDLEVADVQTAPNSAEAFYELQADGDTRTHGGLGPDWLIGSVTGSAYECRATIISGTLSAGSSATGSWLALSGDRAWTVTRASLGSKTCVIDVEIGLASANSALDTARITLSASVESGS